MVYATAVLLLLIVVLLNLTAIIVRNRLRKKVQNECVLISSKFAWLRWARL